MAKCAICEKGAHFGNNVSHSHRKTPKMWKSNVKSVRVKTEGGAKKMYVCTSCLKSGCVDIYFVNMESFFHALLARKNRCPAGHLLFIYKTDNILLKATQ